MTPISALVGAVAGHMATRMTNENDSDGATYLPPVDSQPVVQLLQPMITGEVESVYDYYSMLLFHETQHMKLEEEHRSPGHLQNDESMDSYGGLLDNESNKENALDRPARETSLRPPRGRMALLERAPSSENDVRIALLWEEHKTRMRLMEEEHNNLQKNEEHKMKILRVQKQVELAKLSAMNERM
ncbi:uncharacterized protein LOC119444567 [Dermacentor silvarum]|uniref:uncharacterized protein LOC119444567 n=1 Tax=Dermacentor silvarum TaxID=543639 RepID=UPI00210196F5|nr:uncharacterized protein LOC119444567 [Dermacentor silvarum]